MIQLNLLPDIKKDFLKAQRTRNTVISFSILVTIVAGGLMLLLISIILGQKVFISEFQTKDIKKSAQELRDIPEIDKYLTVQNQLNNIKLLHDDRAEYSRLFSFLQQLNPSAPNNIALNTASIVRADSTIVLEGSARNFQGVNVFKNTLENAQLNYKQHNESLTAQLFSAVALEEASLSNVNGSLLAVFKIRLTYAEAAFAAPTTEATISVPNLVTSDADRNAPKQVFDTKPEGVQ